MSKIPAAVKKRDFIVIAALLFIGAAMLIIPMFSAKADSAEIICGETVKTVSLHKSGEYEVNGVKIVVDGEGICVADSPCPDKLCKNRGHISKAGEVIVCLPQRVIIKVLGKSEIDLSVG